MSAQSPRMRGGAKRKRNSQGWAIFTGNGSGCHHGCPSIWPVYFGIGDNCCLYFHHFRKESYSAL